MRSKSVSFRRRTRLWVGGTDRAVATLGVRVALAIALMATVLSAGVRAQMLTQGPKDPGSSFNDVTFGTIAWTSPNNAMASDGMYAQVSPGTFNSNYLHSDNFNFTIPAPAKIEGIQVDILRHSLAGLIKDARVRLVKGGVVGTTDK